MTFLCSEPSHLSLMDNHCYLKQSPEEVGKQLVSIRGVFNHFWLYQDEEDEPMWQIVQRLPKKEHFLLANEVFRLGKVVMKVKHLVFAPEPLPSFQETRSLDFSSVNEACRVCLNDENTSEDPLISPCKCSGSMQFVHVLCIKEWMKNKITVSQRNQVTSYSWADFACELCKEPLPLAIKIAEQEFQLATIQYPQPPFLVLEEMIGHHPKAIHIIAASRNNVYIGRSHDSHIKLRDISVSRTHAILKYSNGKFSITDCDSKFGTLVLLQGPLLLCSEHSIQVSRSVISIKVKRKWNWKRCFCRPKRIAPQIQELSKEQDDRTNIHT